MAKSRRMTRLGRRGGIVGGVARARALPAAERARIARTAARARWNSRALVIERAPRNRSELSAFVAHFGARVSRGASAGNLQDLALRAVTYSRQDSALARMLPVFLWRNREALDLDQLARKGRRLGEARALGYFLELAGTLGRDGRLRRAAARLRSRAYARRPEYLFVNAPRNPFEAMAAEQQTPAEARRWGLLTGTPADSFATYFLKARDL